VLDRRRPDQHGEWIVRRDCGDDGVAHQRVARSDSNERKLRTGSILGLTRGLLGDCDG
jgi:hypothetical protein